MIAYLIAWFNNNKTAAFYCGRKVSFTIYYTSYIYLADIAGFIVALILNFLTVLKLVKLYGKKANRLEIKYQLRRISFMLVISLVSTICVAIPNIFFLISAWHGRVCFNFILKKNFFLDSIVLG